MFITKSKSTKYQKYCQRKDIKKGIPPYPNLVNLKSNTMKNTIQSYGLFWFLQIMQIILCVL
jgi:hypothetical protein